MLSRKERPSQKHLDAKQEPGVHVTEQLVRKQRITLSLLPFLHPDLLPIVLAYAVSDLFYDIVPPGVSETNANQENDIPTDMRRLLYVFRPKHSNRFLRFLQHYENPLDGSASSFDNTVFPSAIFSHESLQDNFMRIFRYAMFQIKLNLIIFDNDAFSLYTSSDKKKAQKLLNHLREERVTLDIEKSPPTDIYEAIALCAHKMSEAVHNKAHSFSNNPLPGSPSPRYMYAQLAMFEIQKLGGYMTLLRAAQTNTVVKLYIRYPVDHSLKYFEKELFFWKTKPFHHWAKAPYDIQTLTKQSNEKQYFSILELFCEILNEGSKDWQQRSGLKLVNLEISRIMSELSNFVGIEKTRPFQPILEKKPQLPEHGSLYYTPSTPTTSASSALNMKLVTDALKILEDNLQPTLDSEQMVLVDQYSAANAMIALISFIPQLGEASEEMAAINAHKSLIRDVFQLLKDAKIPLPTAEFPFVKPPQGRELAGGS